MTSKNTSKGAVVRNHILSIFEKYNKLSFKEICKQTENLGLKESTIRKHVNILIRQGNLSLSQKIGNKNYYSIPFEFTKSFVFHPKKNFISEDLVWREYIRNCLVHYSKNSLEILDIVFSEIFNNALSHSDADEISVTLNISVIKTILIIKDNGIGIFNKIQQAFNLSDKHQALLELSKGKMTSAPKEHSGEGIFWSSKACDAFLIISSGLAYNHGLYNEDYLQEISSCENNVGTTVVMMVKNNTTKTMRQVYDKYSSPDEGFFKTIVPVKLLRYKDEGIVSRSQAKRLLARFNEFRSIILDFEGIDEIGQAFADEIFRVFKMNHPEIKVKEINAVKSVKNIIKRVSVG